MPSSFRRTNEKQAFLKQLKHFFPSNPDMENLTLMFYRFKTESFVCGRREYSQESGRLKYHATVIYRLSSKRCHGQMPHVPAHPGVTGLTPFLGLAVCPRAEQKFPSWGHGINSHRLVTTRTEKPPSLGDFYTSPSRVLVLCGSVALGTVTSNNINNRYPGGAFTIRRTLSRIQNGGASPQPYKAQTTNVTV